AGVSSPRADAEQLAAHLLGVPRTRLALVPLAEPAVLEAYRKMVDQRAKRIPLQYITGVASVGDVDVEVGPGVFVPRPETELLFAWALSFLQAHCRHAPVVLDLCTGSGALALAIAHARPDAVVHAVERDARALDWARRNAEHRAQAGDTPVSVHAGDAGDPTLLRELDGRVDVVVCNPPYLPLDAELEPEVAEYDPPQALFGGADGLDVIRTIVGNLGRWLSAGGGVAIEHDDANGAGVAQLLHDHGGFTDIMEHPDLAEKPRYVTALRSAF
ncbi:MAG: peptide chain release factor N(5)-glutamine methyltransferase, partial [Aldersonia sp.]|nr:peptide chain release factor N(5)-glutamine methyltransferase [Aldersonia sp.]